MMMMMMRMMRVGGLSEGPVLVVLCPHLSQSLLPVNDLQYTDMLLILHATLIPDQNTQDTVYICHPMHINGLLFWVQEEYVCSRTAVKVQFQFQISYLVGFIVMGVFHYT